MHMQSNRAAWFGSQTGGRPRRARSSEPAEAASLRPKPESLRAWAFLLVIAVAVSVSGAAARAFHCGRRIAALLFILMLGASPG